LSYLVDRRRSSLRLSERPPSHPPTFVELSRFSYYYFASAAVAVDSSRIDCVIIRRSRFSPPSNFVSLGHSHMSTMWFVVCRWPQSQEGDWARPYLCKLAPHGPRPVWKRFIQCRVNANRGPWQLFARAPLLTRDKDRMPAIISSRYQYGPLFFFVSEVTSNYLTRPTGGLKKIFSAS